MAVLLVGIALLMPPIAQAVLMDDRILGLPVPLLYIFVVWGGLIAGTFAVSRQLRETDMPPRSDTKNETAPRAKPPER